MAASVYAVESIEAVEVMSDTFKSLKIGWLIQTDDFIGRVYLKKGNRAVLLNDKGGTIAIQKGDIYTVLDYRPVYEVEENLQKYANDKAKEYGVRLLHLNKDKTGTSKIQEAGWPDCICYAKCGRSFFIELKTKSKLSSKQKIFKQWAVDMGYAHYVATTPIEVDNIFKEYNDEN
jgi:hypothetical protein